PDTHPHTHTHTHTHTPTHTQTHTHTHTNTHTHRHTHTHTHTHHHTHTRTTTLTCPQTSTHNRPQPTSRILAPNDQLCAQEAHRLVLISPNKVHLISTGDVYKRNLSKESYFTPSTSPPWARPKSCPRTSEIRL